MPMKSKHSKSNYKVLSCDGGYLVPVGLQEVLPGDIFNHKIRGLVRAAPMIAPLMHQVDVRLHCWFVPNRLVWTDWENFITGGPDGEDASVHPTIEMTFTAGTPDTGNNQVGYLPDFMGIPPEVNGVFVNALPFRAYNLIFNEFYRDQDLVTPRAVSKASGVDSTTDVTLARIAWEKDYFTSARPWESKGPTLTLPLGTEAPVIGTGKSMVLTDGTNEAGFTQNASDLRVNQGNVGANVGAATSGSVLANGVVFGLSENPANSGLIADLSYATGVDLVTLREYFGQLRYQEARAKYGSRYTEYLAYLGVRSSDARLQRPEYLGGGRVPVQFSEVLQTAPSDADFVGTMAGHGIAGARSNRYRRFFEEHGFVVVLMSIRPKTMYVDGIQRHWSRATKEDYFQKELAAVGAQEVLNKEVQAVHSQPNGVFGYQDRYDEYRRTENTVAGEMRTTLNYWHMAREFSGDVALNSSFVTCTPTDRVFAGSEELIDQFYVMIHHSLQVRSIVPKVAKTYVF